MAIFCYYQIDMQRRVGEDITNWVKRKNLLRLMNEKGIDDKKLTDLYECTPAFIYKLVHGISPIGPEPHKKLAEIFGVDEIEFLRQDTEGHTQAEIEAELDELFEMLRNHPRRQKIIDHLWRQIELLKPSK